MTKLRRYGSVHDTHRWEMRRNGKWLHSLCWYLPAFWRDKLPSTPRITAQISLSVNGGDAANASIITMLVADTSIPVRAYRHRNKEMPVRRFRVTVFTVTWKGSACCCNRLASASAAAVRWTEDRWLSTFFARFQLMRLWNIRCVIACCQRFRFSASSGSKTAQRRQAYLMYPRRT